MDDKNKFRLRKKETRRKKQFILLLIVAVFFIASSTTFTLFKIFNNTAIATPIKETFNIMGENNPINLALNEEIRLIEEEKAKAKIEATRIAEQERLDKELQERKLAEEEKNKSKKIAYLTFDDGPSTKVTPAVLRVLSDYNIKATFFVVGKMVDANPKMMQRIYEEGHAIGHHSYSHDYNYLYKNLDNFVGELNKTDKAFKSVLGPDFETKLLRFPGGSFEKKKQRFVNHVEKLGYSSYDWNALNGDAEGHGLSKNKLINRLKTSAKGKKEIIVLMHDTDAKRTTAEALPEIIKHLIDEGYEFRTLDQY
jgi:peptidoglycan/xylan/chitin deacetylase (PgdA/CDA1 family)